MVPSGRGLPRAAGAGGGVVCHGPRLALTGGGWRSGVFRRGGGGGCRGGGGGCRGRASVLCCAVLSMILSGGDGLQSLTIV